MDRLTSTPNPTPPTPPTPPPKPQNGRPAHLLREPSALLDSVANAVLARLRPEPRFYRTSCTERGTGLGRETAWAVQSADEDAALTALVRCSVREALHLVGLEDAVQAGVREAVAAAEQHGVPLVVLGQGEYQRIIAGVAERELCVGPPVETPARRRAAALGGVLRRLFGGGDAR